ncbi:hypothetical protein O6H91_07G083900 [Diphasiastrum complanatum]|uniref:Uncharacterized protein n=2 Tax=Diphasiastrum complanatum TaxID=34168 RepID=A0ACC2D7L2_DIPCM|nr:hypothetical protein O6H91_07G083900 [Diphasiastrum complanatum]KAJ7550115.1 hypothetical protein O6H91_07G083900 [Diphasiastrum complanatum]
MQRRLLLQASRVRSFVAQPVFSKHFSTSVAEISPSAVPESACSKIHAWNQHRLTSDQLQFQALATEFARKELLPFAAEWDEHKHFPVDVIRKAANLGFGGLFCAQDVGGSQLSRADGAVIFESLAYGDISTVAYLTIHNMCCSLIDRFGTTEQRKDWLPRLTSLELLSSYSLTEPSSGSDAASLQTTARQVHGGSDYILNGSKAFVSGGGVSDVYLLMARTGPLGAKGISCFLVEKGMPGLSFGRQEDKLGWRSQPTATVILEDVRVPESNLLGKEGQGFNIAMTGLDGGRINIASCSVGGAQFCFDAALDYVHTRKQFGKAIIEFQSTQFKLADMVTALQASRLMVANAASSFDLGAPGASASIAMAKRFATDTCYDICNDALQLHGGYGYLKDYMVERYVRDLRVHSILEGTNEIMRVVIARHLKS